MQQQKSAGQIPGRQEPPVEADVPCGLQVLPIGLTPLAVGLQSPSSAEEDS